MKRNLIYHIYPRPCEMLKFNIDLLVRYLDRFNGQRIIYVVTDKDTLDAKTTIQVLEMFGISGEFFIRSNSMFTDSSYLVEKLATVQSTDPNEITCYAHAKGVSADILSRRQTTIPALKAWIQTMYHFNLMDMNCIEGALSRHPCTGTFRCSNDRSGGMKTLWYYAGTFFWYNHQAVYSREWQKTTGTPYASEEYLGNLFPIEQSGCLGGRAYENVGDLYSPQTLLESRPELII